MKGNIIDRRMVSTYSSAVKDCQPLQARWRWSSASRVKRDSLLNTMRCQSDGNNNHRLRHHSRRFRRCFGVKSRRLKHHCECNLASDKRHEIVGGTMGLW
ncbi:hypothetical protein TNCV_2470841 [Trichonephila clavipes]|nr:hypothetical protein TNCV_2470841 [Trichonephila clavipes]